MNLSYENDLTSESRQRDEYRCMLSTLCIFFEETSPLGRLSDREDLPATEVLALVPSLYRWAGYLTDEQDRRYASVEIIGRFETYVKRQAKLEAVAAKADRLVAAVVKAGIGYSKAQDVFVSALDRYSEKHPKAFAPPEGR